MGTHLRGGQADRTRPPRSAAPVIYDPDLTLTLPARIAGVSGMNAIAMRQRRSYAPDATPNRLTLMAVEGVRALTRRFPR